MYHELRNAAGRCGARASSPCPARGVRRGADDRELHHAAVGEAESAVQAAPLPVHKDVGLGTAVSECGWPWRRMLRQTKLRSGKS
eukprot:COSAG02_NODE_2744_length_8112_cov_1.766255_2_plen_85_part_00